MLSNGEDRGQGTRSQTCMGVERVLFQDLPRLSKPGVSLSMVMTFLFWLFVFCCRCRIENKKQFFENARLYERKTFLLLIEKYLNWRPPTLYFLARRARLPMVSGHRSKFFDPMASLSQSFLVLWALRWCLGLPLTPSGWMS